MQNEPVAEKVKDIWKQQPIEEQSMSIELFRLRTREVAIQSRLQFVAVVALMAGLVIFNLWSYAAAAPSLQRGGFALAAGLTGAALIQLARKLWPGSLAKYAGSMACLAFARFEIERKLGFQTSFLIWLAGPIFVTSAVLVGPVLADGIDRPEELQKGVPAVILLVVWIVSFLFVQRRQRRGLVGELKEMEALSGNGQARQE